MEETFIVIKDAEGILRPKAYLERKELHHLQKHPKLEEGDTFVEVTIKEVTK